MARGKRLGFLVGAAPPDRADGVDHMPGRQTVAGGRLCLSRAAAAEPAAFRGQLRPGGSVDRAVDAAAAEQRAVGGIHDRVDCLSSDVTVGGFDHARDATFR